MTEFKYPPYSQFMKYFFFQKQVMILQPPRRLPAGKREYIVTLAREEFQRSSECLHMDPAHIKGPAVWVYTSGPSPCIAV